MAKFATNVSGAMLLLSLIQVTESISGSVVPLAMFKVTITIECNGCTQPLGSMVFRCFWDKTTIDNDGFQWLCTIGPTMEWLRTIVEVLSLLRKA